MESVHDIHTEVVDYFKSHFSDSEVDRPTLDGVPFISISEEDLVGLTSPFGDEEIRGVVVDSDGSKCPGPDGFNFAFYKKFWDLLKDEVRVMFDHFYHSATLPRGFSSYFVTLIPKVHSPSNLGDFRPISLLGSLYKLVAKVLAGRLAPVMDKIISSNQFAFIKGRQLVDGVVAVNEIIDFARKAKKDCLIFKVDFEKAYDSVSWNFLEYMMRRLGFGVRWCRWIRACVCCGNLSVLVNGCPTEEINIQRGLKQGDPLAPFLFLLVVEGLSGLVRSAESHGLYEGFKVGNSGLSISHLQYADDTLFVGEASMQNLWSLKTILRCFELASGLKVNFHKSSVMGVNVGDEFLGLAERFLYCRVGGVPFTYLGLPVGANPRLEKTWQPLLQLLTSRLGSWGNKFVSLGGRVVLLNSVLNAIPIFYLSVMKMPGKVWKKIVRLQREFLWGGVKRSRSIPWVSWAIVCRPKREGGLGVRDLRQVNLALLGKWRWRYLIGDGGLWHDILTARYGACSPSPHIGGRPSGLRGASSWWSNISFLGGDKEAASDWFSDGVVRVVGDGLSTHFWHDLWVDYPES